MTYGFSELYVKESDDPETSGWGFELTFRLARVEGEEELPGWAFNLLQNLARYVFNSWTLEIVPSEIKDPDGNVVETIG